MTEPIRTKSGKLLTDADIQRLADEAEAGFDIDAIVARRFLLFMAAAWPHRYVPGTRLMLRSIIRHERARRNETA